MIKALQGAGLALALLLSTGLTFASPARAETGQNVDVGTEQTITTQDHRTYSGLITDIDSEGDFVVLQSGNTSYRMNLDNSTHLFVSPNQTGVLGDFEVGDRIVVHLNRGHRFEAGSITRIGGEVRGDSDDHEDDEDEDNDDDTVIDGRLRTFTADLTATAVTSGSTGSLTLTMGENAHLDGKYGDKFGEEGDSITVYYSDNTNFTRRYGGAIEASDLHLGDHLVLTGYISTNGNIIVTAVHDMSLWVYGVMWHTAEIVSIDTETNTLVLQGDNFRGLDETVTVHYDADTAFMVDGSAGDEMDLSVGASVHVRGEAHDDGEAISISDVTNIWVSVE
jgi:hypothetical protein